MATGGAGVATGRGCIKFGGQAPETWQSKDWNTDPLRILLLLQSTGSHWLIDLTRNHLVTTMMMKNGDINTNPMNFGSIEGNGISDVNNRERIGREARSKPKQG